MGARWPLIAISESRKSRRNSVYPLNAGSLFPPPALGERCDRGLARRLVAVSRGSSFGGGGGGFGGLRGGGFGGFGGRGGSVRPDYALGAPARLG